MFIDRVDLQPNEPEIARGGPDEVFEVHTDAERDGLCENPIGCPTCSEATADDYPEAK